MKVLACERRQIRSSRSVDAARLEFLSPPDAYALLGNAIDNAIEGSERFPAPGKRVISRPSAAKTVLSVSRPTTTATPSPKDGGLPVTTKADRINHGFGLKSIRYLSGKYGGTMCVSIQDRIGHAAGVVRDNRLMEKTAPWMQCH